MPSRKAPNSSLTTTIDVDRPCLYVHVQHLSLSIQTNKFFYYQDARNPDSSLSIPQTQKFASRYSDPNHPAVNGSLISLVTGGYIDPNRIKSGLSGSSGQQSGGLGRGRGLLPSRSGGLLVPNRRSEMKENMQQGRRYGITGRILRQVSRIAAVILSRDFDC